jgi:hypothetical protein
MGILLTNPTRQTVLKWIIISCATANYGCLRRTVWPEEIDYDDSAPEGISEANGGDVGSRYRFDSGTSVVGVAWWTSPVTGVRSVHISNQRSDQRNPRLWPNTPPLFAVFPELQREILETPLSRETQRWIETQVLKYDARIATTQIRPDVIRYQVRDCVFYTVHGVEVPPWWVTQPERLSVQDFLKNRNASLRRVLLTLMDKSSLLKAATMVDRSAEATLYELPLDNGGRWDWRSSVGLLNVEWLTKDRERQSNILFVPGGFTEAEEARRWTLSLDETDTLITES